MDSGLQRWWGGHLKIPGGFLGSLSKFLGQRAGTIQVFSRWQRSGSSPSLEGVRNPGEAEHGDVGGCGRKHPPPTPPDLPGIPRFSQQELGVGRGLGLAALAHALVSEQPVRAGEALWVQGGSVLGLG